MRGGERERTTAGQNTTVRWRPGCRPRQSWSRERKPGKSQEKIQASKVVGWRPLIGPETYRYWALIGPETYRYWALIGAACAMVYAITTH